MATLLLFARELPVQSFQFLLGFAVVTGVLYRVALGVGIEDFYPHVDTDLLSRRHMHDDPLCLDTELDIIAISTMNNPHPLDLPGRKGCNLLLGITNQAQPPDPT